MTSLQILVWCQSLSIIILAYICYRNAKEIKKCNKLSPEEFEKRISDIKAQYIDNIILIMDSIREREHKIKENISKKIDEFIASKYQEYWEKQFFMNKPDTKNG